jgi:hypothetical protein
VFVSTVYAISVGDCRSQSKPAGYHQRKELRAIAVVRAVRASMMLFLAPAMLGSDLHVACAARVYTGQTLD